MPQNTKPGSIARLLLLAMFAAALSLVRRWRVCRLLHVDPQPPVLLAVSIDDDF